MNDISQKQNEGRSLDLLFAQRYLYSLSKSYFSWRTLFAVMLAIIGPMISVNTGYSVYVCVLAIFYLLIDNLLLEKIENSKKEEAAKIQELFDTRVLTLPWERIVSGTMPETESIALILAENPDRDYHKLKLYDWYALDVGKIGIDVARFICQRSNAWWDEDLRKKHLWFTASVLFLLLFLATLLGVLLDLAFTRFIMGIIIPILPLIELLIKQIRDHFETSRSMKQLKEALDAVIEQIMQGNNPTKPEKLSRTFQDEIFRHRKRSPMVFDWTYWLFRNKQEYQMQFSVKHKVEEYLSKLK